MLGVRFIRENPEKIKASEKKRGKDPKVVDSFLDYDKKWRESLQELQHLRHQKNRIVDEIKKEGRDEEKIKKSKEISKKIKDLEEKNEGFKNKMGELRYQIGNVLHDDVPEGENVEIKKAGKKPEFDFKPKSHVDLGEKLDIIDTDKAGEVSGSRYYYLKGKLVLLNMALQKFAMDHMIKKGFMPFHTPFILRRKAMSAAAELGDFDEQLYKIEGEDRFLIATAEQTLAAYHMNETLLEKDLPKNYVGFSTNFRKEAGAHGKDTKGIFRVHQFDKVEEFVFCKPEESWSWLEKLLEYSEEIYQKLGIPYRVVDICAGDMNDNAARKYDIEAWMPAQNEYREVVSCSNCTDYQARKLNVKYRRREGEAPKGFVHTLNSTVVANQRTIVAIMENYQQKDGSIKVPKALKPYLGFEKI